MASQSKNDAPHDLNCLTIQELEKHAELRMDKQTRDYYVCVVAQGRSGVV